MRAAYRAFIDESSSARSTLDRIQRAVEPEGRAVARSRVGAARRLNLPSPTITSSRRRGRGLPTTIDPSETDRDRGSLTLFCTRCGHPNRDDARFCAECGLHCTKTSRSRFRPIEPDDEGHDEFPFPHDELEPGQALLLVKRGPNAGSTFLLDDGRDDGRVAIPDSAVFLDDITVSRKHAVFERRGRRSGSSATSEASTAPTSTASRSTRPSSRPATRSRSASSS